MKDLAVIFPGVGYHSDKPLLYHAKKLAGQYGFEVLEIVYGEIPSGNVKKQMDKVFSVAFESAEKTLEKVDFSQYDRILFISKSVGTAVASTYQKELVCDIHNIYFTPVTASLPMLCGDGIVFSGTADDWVEAEDVKRTCEQKKFPLYMEEQANHSMETGNVQRDIQILQACFEECERYIRKLKA